MDHRSEVRDFLTTRRARISPADAGVVDDGGLRRVPGLRRREVAELAGVLAVNLLGRAVYAEMFEDRTTPPNLARFAFLDERSHRFYPDWDRAANDTVAILRTEAGRDPYDEDLTTLVGQLLTQSREFRVRWTAHNVNQHYTGKKHLHHPVVGDLYLTYQALDLFADQGLSLLVYTPQPDTGTNEALDLLASGPRQRMQAPPRREQHRSRDAFDLTAPARSATPDHLRGPSAGPRATMPGTTAGDAMRIEPKPATP